MVFTIPANGLPFTLTINVSTDSPQVIRIVARDYAKTNTDFIIRRGKVNGMRSFDLKFPQTPKVMNVYVYNTNCEQRGLKPTDNDNSFRVTKFEVRELKTCPFWINDDVKSFVEFAQKFAQNASILSAGDPTPSSYRSKNGKFCIDYYNKIRDRKSGNFVGTPARIGHSTGIIEVSKQDFLKYTVPMRMVILLHEFSHKYMNPVSKRQISDEIAADINALNIYLSLGYPSIEAQYAFLNVFKDANNEINNKRYLILNDFISKFTKGQLQNNCVTDYTLSK